MKLWCAHPCGFWCNRIKVGKPPMLVSLGHSFSSSRAATSNWSFLMDLSNFIRWSWIRASVCSNSSSHHFARWMAAHNCWTFSWTPSLVGEVMPIGADWAVGRRFPLAWWSCGPLWSVWGVSRLPYTRVLRAIVLCQLNHCTFLPIQSRNFLLYLSFPDPSIGVRTLSANALGCFVSCSSGWCLSSHRANWITLL